MLQPICFHPIFGISTPGTAAPVNCTTLVCCTGTALRLLGLKKPTGIVTTGPGGGIEESEEDGIINAREVVVGDSETRDELTTVKVSTTDGGSIGIGIARTEEVVRALVVEEVLGGGDEEMAGVAVDLVDSLADSLGRTT